MKITNAQKIKLGMFVLLTGVVLIISLYFIGKKQNLFGDTFKITAVFNNVNGLKIGNNVRYAGIHIGTVNEIIMVNDSIICVDMIIEEKIREHMKRDAYAIVGSDGLVGSMVVNIFPGDRTGQALQEGDTIYSIRKKSANDMMSTLSITNENAAELSKELLKMTQRINEGKGTLGLLVNDETMGADLKSTITNLKGASEDASKVIYEIHEVIRSANDEDNILNILLKDSAAAHQFRTILVNVELASKNMNQLIQNLNETVLSIKDGEGTFNYIMSDTILVQDIDETVRNIKKGSEMLNENLEALRHNTFFKGYFKKQEKERLKEEKKLKKSED